MAVKKGISVSQKAAHILNQRKAAGETWEGIAADLSSKSGQSISGALVWKVTNGRCSSKVILKALGLARHQIRLAATVTPEEREALQQLATTRGMTWTEFCKDLARGSQ